MPFLQHFRRFFRRVSACIWVFAEIFQGIIGRMLGNSELESKEFPKEHLVRPYPLHVPEAADGIEGGGDVVGVGHVVGDHVLVPGAYTPPVSGLT